jgi:hypothetical protein
MVKIALANTTAKMAMPRIKAKTVMPQIMGQVPTLPWDRRSKSSRELR